MNKKELQKGKDAIVDTLLMHLSDIEIGIDVKHQDLFDWAEDLREIIIQTAKGNENDNN